MSKRLSLVVRRTIAAGAPELFRAWTEPALLVQWWGPAGIACPQAEIDLRVGGALRIANRFADGRIAWIHGVFERIEPPHLLVYSWQFGSTQSTPERVTVRFEPRGDAACEVIVVHERIADAIKREEHQLGWTGCLDGLARLFSADSGA